MPRGPRRKKFPADVIGRTVHITSCGSRQERNRTTVRMLPPAAQRRSLGSSGLGYSGEGTDDSGAVGADRQEGGDEAVGWQLETDAMIFILLIIQRKMDLITVPWMPLVQFAHKIMPISTECHYGND